MPRRAGGLGTHYYYYYYYLLPTSYYLLPTIFFRERALALSPRSTFKPLGGVEVERVFRRGDTPPIFKGPAVLRRCCPPSAEGVACCRSPHQPRGAAAVLPFFSARAEEAARCQCLRGWAQAVGHVTPSLNGGPPCFFMGDVAGGSAIVPRREGGPAHTQSFVSEPKDCGLGSTGAFFFFFWGSALPLFSFGDGGGPLPFLRPCGVAAVLPSFCGRSGVLPKSA